MYIRRHIETVVQKVADSFPTVILTGSRQVGKTTLLRELFAQASYATLDRLDVLDAASNDPERFLAAASGIAGGTAIIDEVQYAPQLFRYVKIAVDEQRHRRGRFLLTGSQRFLMMQGVSESLVGRAAVLEMLGLSMRELSGSSFCEPFLPTQEYLDARLAAVRKDSAAPHAAADAAAGAASTAPDPAIPAEAAVAASSLPAAYAPHNAHSGAPADNGRECIWNLIVRGDLPELHANTGIDTIQYYDSFIETYLRRDVRDLASVGDLAAFNRFMGLLAQMHGRQLNKTDLAARTGVAVATVGRWLSVLEASGIIFMLKPMFANTGKRLTKSPKLYFCNSGLAARLCRIATGQDLAQSPQAGEFFEGFVIAEVIKSHLNHTGTLPDAYYYRDSNRNEIDLVLADGSNLYPIEIKSATVARPSDAAAFRHLDALSGYVRRPGAVVCDCAQPLPLPDGNWAIPVHLI